MALKTNLTTSWCSACKPSALGTETIKLTNFESWLDELFSATEQAVAKAGKKTNPLGKTTLGLKTAAIFFHICIKNLWW